MSDSARGYEVVVTRGGAHAVLDRASGEVMHPVVGPMFEAQALYVGPSRLHERLSEYAPTPLVVFDVGLGAASNAISAWHVSEALGPEVRQLSLVSFDINVEALRLASTSEHAEAFGLAGAAQSAAQSLIAERQHRTARTSWRLELASVPECFLFEAEASVDIVYWDMFSRRTHPDLWTVGAFSSIRRLCRSGATLHTYSRATATRSALLLAGFAVGIGVTTGEGKPTTIAASDVDDLQQPLDQRWLERLTRSSAPFAPDAPSDALKRIRSMPQFA